MKKLSDLLFALLPTIPYERSEPSTESGFAVIARNFTSSPSREAPSLFKGANFEIPKGCRTALIGPNGCGKSTLLRTLAGLIKPQGGEIIIAGAPPKLGRKSIAYLSQRPQFTDPFPITLKRIVQMGTYAHHGWFEECRHNGSEVDRALHQLALTDIADFPVHILSGGQLQRALIARSVVQGAEILLLDEPYSALDRTSRLVIETFLFEQGHEFTVLMATHDPSDLVRFDQIIEICDSSVVTRNNCQGHKHV